MKDQFPLYPDLSEEGNIEAQKLVDQFKQNLKKVAHEVMDETIDELYCNIIPHIQSDSWTNFRNSLMDGFRNYDNRNLQGTNDFKEIRQQIYKEFRSEIINDLNQDNLDEIEKLKKRIEWLEKIR